MIFGADVDGYEDGRPTYPEAVYAALAEAGALRPGITVFEVGPGTGQATARLIEVGVASLAAVEPDPQLAAYLATRFADTVVEVVNASFEAADLPPGAFDLGIAATSFHWVDPATGLARAHDLLRPGGIWAMWWNLVHDPAGDAFSRALLPILCDVTLPPSLRGATHDHYALRTDDRIADLRDAGFVDVAATILSFDLPMSAARIRALYATFSMVRRLDPLQRSSMLDAIERVAMDDFGGTVARTFRTPLYIARKPI